jgi:hypothetical protein
MTGLSDFPGIVDYPAQDDPFTTTPHPGLVAHQFTIQRRDQFKKRHV